MFKILIMLCMVLLLFPFTISSEQVPTNTLCWSCQGSGSGSTSCPTCGGTGKSIGGTQCYQCMGRGLMRCSVCNGTGQTK